MKKVKDNQREPKLRRRAEKQLEIAAGSTEAFSEMSPEKMASLIHELQVHQIELKMQNDELRRIQNELEEARDRYSELYDFAPSGFATLSEKGLILEANLTCATLLGSERGLILGKPFSRFIAGDAQDNYYFLLRNLLETKAPRTCEMKLIREGSEPVLARLDCIVKEDAADRALYIFVAITDITERKQAQEVLQNAHDELARQVEKRTISLKRANEQLKLEIEKLRLAEAALRESQEKYRSLVEFTSDSIYLVDKDCNYLFMNLKYQKRIGLVSTQVEGTAYSVYHSKHETDAFREKVEIIFETGRPLSYEYQSERDGSYFVRTLSPVMEGKTVQAVSVISKDITAQRLSETEAHNNRLELAYLERIATMGELAASLAHELSQPLTAILSNAQAALRFIHGNPPKIDEVRAILQDIVADDKRASEIIQHLRVFFKKGELDKKPLNINSLIADVISLFRSEAVFRNISIETALGLKLVSVRAHEIQLQQVRLKLTPIFALRIS